jgi:hypothetical protein
MVDHGDLDINNKFRMRKIKEKKHKRYQNQSMGEKYSLNKTVGKTDFDNFLQSQKDHIQNSKTTAAR